MASPPRPTGSFFDRAPFLVFWELTQACDLACKHCRACAVPDRDPRELTFEEGKHLLDEVAAMGCPLAVLTGGNPAKSVHAVQDIRLPRRFEACAPFRATHPPFQARRHLL
jgi:organic radical activating enzyme